ncbi:MAG TPA: preprotein translocase subunit SecA [Patescibacteria group bacterium]|nr:preprotein translocase subunit SecA [Patescibacteria group bacterium]
MLGFIKQQLLRQKQGTIKNRYPLVNIVLHPDMPSPSLGKMVEASAIVHKVNALERKMVGLTDKEFKTKTEELKVRIAQKSEGHEAHFRELRQAIEEAAIQEEKERLKDKLKSLRNTIFEDVLPEAFALVREASKRTIGLRHFDVQIAGGLILHEGKIAEMSTGEGKTLVATLPAYLNALLGKGVHVVTVNDYLARRDRDWMGPVYEFLGLSVGVIQHQMSDEQRQVAYACDITYGTNNEFGFDYLRDNMKYDLKDLVQRPFYYAIVDEVDSILIDEARTPLIISGPAEESTDKYYVADRVIPKLKGRKILEKEQIEAKHRGEDPSKGYDYVIDEKAHAAYLTEQGEAKACTMLGIGNMHDMETMEWRHHIIQALSAHNLYQKDVHYVIKDGAVIIVDEFTGRMMPGRRWSDGLHQAVEAKEGLKIERENQTLATVTFQNYFRMYEKLAGMTGTAFTEANEFKAIYKLDVVVIPTNKPLIRTNHPDRVYKTEEEKFDAVVEEIVELHKAGRPVLVGTISIDRSERLSEMLRRKGVTHQVLNAKYHEQEAQIVAQAGRFGAVTIATNMAGRGTDILLGGNPDFIAKSVIKEKLAPEDPAYETEYRALLEKFRQETVQEHKKVVSGGGLHVLGTERHEARRIDNQLRGRCGRQGDPGSSRFYVSLGDELMRLFGSDRLVGLMDTMGLERGQVIEHSWVTKSIEIAQRRVETHNFEIRKQLLEYDNVMNKQREIIYARRKAILEGVSLKADILEIIDGILADTLAIHLGDRSSGQEWDIAGLISTLKLKFGLDTEESLYEGYGKDAIQHDLYDALLREYETKEKNITDQLMRHLERTVFLQIIDAKWKDHLYAMDSLREGIGLRAYGQRDPLIEYKREAFDMFSRMMQSIEEEAIELIFKLQPAPPKEFRGVFSSMAQQFIHPEAAQFEPPQEESEAVQRAPQRLAQSKVGRNDPCPCGSGKKYKKCCGK